MRTNKQTVIIIVYPFSRFLFVTRIRLFLRKRENAVCKFKSIVYTVVVCTNSELIAFPTV